MAKAAAALQSFSLLIGKGINKAKVAIDRVLWGNVYNVPAVPAPGTAPAPPKKTKVGSLIQSGLFNALDALLSVDLCNVMTYLLSSNAKIPQKRKDPSEATAIENALYTLQDTAVLIRQAIDQFYAFPSDVIHTLTDPDPSSTPAPGTTRTTDVDPNTLAGSNMQKYNYGIVGAYIQKVFRKVGRAQALAQGGITGLNEITQTALFDPEIQAALSIIPGFNTNINALQDYVNIIDKYADFRSIPNDEFQKLLATLDKVRAVCVTIEGFSLGGALDLAQQFTGTDVRSEIAKLNQFIDPKKIIKNLKDINDALQSTIKVCKTVIGYIKIGRGVIKIALVLIKMYKYVAKLISNTPPPAPPPIPPYLPYNVTAKLENAKEAAKETSTDLQNFLAQLASILGIVIGVIRYLEQNIQALLIRLQRLLAILEGCDNMNGSEILSQLKQSQADLIATQKELASILAAYDNKASNNTYGAYTIRVVDEELVDQGIRNKRRRGVALDSRGIIAAQSDLTFATDDAIIIEEVKVKLASLGLVNPELSPTDLTIIQAQSFLGDSDFNMDDLDVETKSTASILNAYYKSIPGLAVAKQRLRKKVKTTSTGTTVIDNAVKQQIATQMTNSSTFLGIINKKR